MLTLLIIFLPAFSFLILVLFGRYIGTKGAQIVSCVSIFLSLFLSVFYLYKIALTNNAYYITLGKWIYSDTLIINWGFYIDSVAAIMIPIILIVSFIVHFYSTDYLKEEPHLLRFLSYLSLFTFFMLFLITSANFAQLFLGWEGVGICSYLLINFWYTRLAANKAALKAIIINKIGDVALLFAIILIYLSFRSIDFSTIFVLVPYLQFEQVQFFTYNVRNIDLICVFLLIGAVGKSAQISLHTWLPDAMEGPTPVSALIHAATMVTAGIFLIIRCSALFEYAPAVLSIITLIGGFTTVFAGIIGVFQTDVKKIIAYSTCSQLGYMFLTTGLSLYSLSLFHLLNHALFKALLFLLAGLLIHTAQNIQDTRQLSVYGHTLLLSGLLTIGSSILAGFPFFSSFYSKDIIIESANISLSISSQFIYELITISACFTIFYSCNLVYDALYSFFSTLKIFNQSQKIINLYIYVLLSFLNVISIIFGYIFQELFIGVGTPFFGNSILILPENMNLFDLEYIPGYIKNLPLFFTIFGMYCGYFLFIWMEEKFDLSQTVELNLLLTVKNYYGLGYYVYNFFSNKLYFDSLYNFFSEQFLKYAYYDFFKLLDKGFFESFGISGAFAAFTSIYNFLSHKHTGLFFDYCVYLVFGLVLVFFVFEIAIFVF